MDQSLQKLIVGCRHGDAGAQRNLFDQYRTPLFAVCLRYARDRPEAQDILQEAFLTIFRDLGQFKGEGSFEGWLRKVTVRCALQHLRRKNPLRFAEDYDELPHDTRHFVPDTELNSESLLRMVQLLAPGYRTIFNLHCMESFSYAEIAVELGISESTVRSQYARACKQLRSLVEKLLTTVF